jgi:hypothetical protein
MNCHVKNDKLKLLVKKLQGLDIDEGIRIEGSLTVGKKIFINKNTSDIFVVQLVKVERRREYNSDFRYFDSPEEVIEFVNLNFKGQLSLAEY